MHSLRGFLKKMWPKYPISLIILLLLVTGVAFAGESSLSSSSTVTSQNWTQDTPTTPFAAYRLYLGAEGTSVSDINNKATVRTQLMLYNRIYRWKPLGIDFFGDLILTSVTSSATTTATTSTASVSQAIGGDISLYLKFPIQREGENWISTVGPIYTFETLKPTNANEVTRSNLFGLRLQYNPEAFADLLYGKNEGTEGRRVELRVQAPITQLQLLRSPTIVGIIANIGVSDRPQNNVDSIKIYVMWPMSIESIFTGGSSTGSSTK